MVKVFASASAIPRYGRRDAISSRVHGTVYLMFGKSVVANHEFNIRIAGSAVTWDRIRAHSEIRRIIRKLLADGRLEKREQIKKKVKGEKLASWVTYGRDEM
jgi:hypothetical protein